MALIDYKAPPDRELIGRTVLCTPFRDRALVRRAVLCTPFAERRARSDAPYLFTYTRERRRPVPRLRDEYFIARRLGSIFISPVPLFTSMI